MIRLIPTLLLLLARGALQAAPPELTAIFPSGGAAGALVETTLSGTFPSWPVSIWTSHPDIQAEAGSKGQLKIRVKDNAPFGPRLVRVYSKEGVSAVRPFWVGNLREVMEAEPNDHFEKAMKLASTPLVVNGKLANPGDADSFAIQVKQGQTLVARLQANLGLDSPMDAVLQILSPEGFVVAENHDRHGLDPLVFFTANKAGDFRLRLFAFPSNPDSSIRLAGAENFIYRLTVTTGPFLDHAFPMAARVNETQVFHPQGWNFLKGVSYSVKSPSGNDSWFLTQPGVAGWQKIATVSHQALVDTGEKSPTLSAPVSLSGVLLKAPRQFKLEGKKGEKYFLQIEARTRGSQLDPVLILKDALGKEIRRVDDSGASADPNLEWTSTGDPAFLEIADLHRQTGPGYYYQLSFTPVAPEFSLTLEADLFISAGGKEVEAPVKVTRSGGHAGPIQIAAMLPSGWTSQPVTHLPKDGAIVKIKIKPQGNAAPGSFTLLGESAGVKFQVEKSFSAFDATLRQFWISQ
ncbi:MAG: hypothetical protein EXR99_14260 [Gemmataceae bacterium]|nr:hypothetical protein [Gemmataceae bacterium]